MGRCGKRKSNCQLSVVNCQLKSFFLLAICLLMQVAEVFRTIIIPTILLASRFGGVCRRNIVCRPYAPRGRWRPPYVYGRMHYAFPVRYSRPASGHAGSRLYILFYSLYFHVSVALGVHARNGFAFRRDVHREPAHAGCSLQYGLACSPCLLILL